MILTGYLKYIFIHYDIMQGIVECINLLFITYHELREPLTVKSYQGQIIYILSIR